MSLEKTITYTVVSQLERKVDELITRIAHLESALQEKSCVKNFITGHCWNCSEPITVTISGVKHGTGNATGL